MKRTSELTRTAFKRPKHTQHGAFLRMVPKAASARVEAPDEKPCSICTKPFRPWSSTQVVCSLPCAKRVPVVAKKAERAKDKAQRDKLKPISEWEKEAEHEVNRYVRMRDAHLGCVSCDKPASWPGQWHASHFRSVGAASAVRFHLWNIHKACSQCNKWQSGNLSEYEPRLIAKIGKERVDWLRTQNQITRRSVEYLKRLKRVFSKKANRKERRNAI